MKSSRSRTLRIAVAGLLLLFAAAAFLPRGARADLPGWLAVLRISARLDGVFTVALPMASGTTLARRPPKETRDALSRLIASAPSEADLYALRARAEEEQLDAAAAEADWIQHAKLAADPAAGNLALADFYHRRLRPVDEMRALEAAAQAPAAPADRFRAPSRQRAWGISERMVALAAAQAMPSGTAYRFWIKLYPRERGVFQRYINELAAKKQFAAVEQALAEYAKAFPADAAFPLEARARMEQARSSPAAALAIYQKAFEPLWSAELVKNYFALLSAQHHLSAYLSEARAALAANPGDLSAAARIFYYHQQQGNLPGARRVLIEYRQRREAAKSTWDPASLWTLGRLLEAVHDYDEAARSYHALYALPAAAAGDRERALAALINLLFIASDQPLELGAGDLSYYKDIATLDPHPGFLNGILSLLLNSAQPEWRYSDQERASVAYFRRARAAEMLALFDAKFPKSDRRAALRAQLVEAYAAYSESDAVIRSAREFLAAFPRSPQRTGVAMRMAEAYARKLAPAEEFAVYAEELQALAAQAEGVPLGESGDAPAAETENQVTDEDSEQPATAPSVRSPEYARVLDRYISRLVVTKRKLQALQVLRGELDRNPNDPGLYARLAAFLEQNKLETDIEQVYRRAIQQFPTMSWYDRLARWYVRHKRTAQLDQLSRQVVDTFAGSELETYFRHSVMPGPLTASLFRDLNLYAHERFPYDLVFVRNLLYAYANRPTLDLSAYERLLREYWFHADDLRARFFERLSSTGRLDAELKAIGRSHTAAVRFAAEAEAWRSHFEAAAAGLEASAAEFPADAPLAVRAASLDRSLAAFDPQLSARAVEITDRLHRFDLRDHAPLTRMGEIWADREELARARPLWDQIARIEPGNTAGYLEAATIFWDYYQFNDALRLIEQARKQSGDPALFAYEAGAVYENKRDYARAVAEYFRGAAPGGSARERLMTLARRPAHRALIDRISAERVAGADPPADAVSLRIAVLDAQERRAEVTGFLADLAARATSVDLVYTIRSNAEARGADEAVERALEREIAIAPDPLDRTRARLALMRLCEGRRDTARARAIVEQLHQDQPRILGVVRATTDFYWRNKMTKEAVDTLAVAAAVSNPTYQPRFLLEAAEKATASADYPRAREFASALLKQDPFHAGYVAAMAAIFAAEHDDPGLRTFFQDRIEAVRTSSLAPAERTSRIAALRRNLIPVLTRQKDHAAALDQYIEALRNYPGDEALAREAALYAEAHGQRERLLAWFTKALADSPRDYRWPMLLARIETSLEDLPAAVDAYKRASAIRPDRADLLTARIQLEERLMRFEDALAGYTKLYDLSYRNPQWMEKAASIHARLGRTAAAVKALETAFLEGRPERPDAFFDIARILDGWDMPAEARPFAERGMALAGDAALRAHSAGASVYARLMTRLRAHEIAIERLRAVRGDTRYEFQNVLRAVGETVKRHFTPEEKQSLEAFLDREKGVISVDDLMPLVEAAGMSGLEAKWRFEQLMAKPDEHGYLEALIRLQRLRMKQDELGVEIEAAWKVCTEDSCDGLAERAAEAFREAGNPGAELRILTLRHQNSELTGLPLKRYFELLAAHAPARLLAEAAGESRFNNRDLAVETAIASGNAQLALDAVRARGRGLPPVWTRAYAGLTGVYFARPEPEIGTAFTELLGEAPIGARLGKTVDRKEQLAGGQWFPYAAVYGEYVSLARSADPEDYLPALVEGTPARGAAYATLGDVYRENRAPERALADYARAVELDAARGDVHDRMAVILWDLGRKDEAVAQWEAALEAFRRQEDRTLAETFWTALPAALENVGSRKLLAQVRSQADAVLRTYVRRNGDYRAGPLIEGALAAAAGSSEGVEWLLDLSRAASIPVDFLRTAAASKRLETAQREALYGRILTLMEADAAKPGPQHYEMLHRLQTERVAWIGFLLDTGQTARAQTDVNAMLQSEHGVWENELARLALRAAAQAKDVPRLLQLYAAKPERAPGFETLIAAAADLKRAGDPAARRILEFAYTRELDNQNLTPANLLGLAEVRLEDGNLDAALALLRRMNAVSGEPFENLVPAAELLEKTGHANEAREFRAARAKAVPWDMENRAAMSDAAVARSPLAPYAARLDAARRTRGANLGGAELDLIASSTQPAASAAERPYFYAARLAAARAASPAQDRLRLASGALAIQAGGDSMADSSLRLLLFRSAVELKRPHAALAVFRPLVPYWPSAPEPDSGEEESSSYWDSGFLSGRFDTAERAEIARGMAAASIATGDPARAETLYRIALQLQPSPQVESALAEVRAERAQRAANARRKPIVTAELDQPHLVQPRLTSRVPAGGSSR